MIQIAITNQQSALSVDDNRLREAVRAVLEDAGRASAEISLAVVDDPTIHDLNRKYLNHDYATDVLSFLLEDDQDHLVGDVVASAATATAAAERFAWTPADELLLYAVHGTLHLVGYDDKTPQAAAEMRTQEARVLARFGLNPRYEPTGERLKQTDGPNRPANAPDRKESDFSVGDISS